ncbi:hypothetical protein M9Y10_035108 [Tritrichomonas musculus]|uniref:Uncharacterized protein n=1 Tax=Tritrichomonas musculus TaxID=1915356 RepID=A0ABR2KGQ2_9EUKA
MINRTEAENSSKYETISTIEEFDSLLNNINQGISLNQNNQPFNDRNILIRDIDDDENRPKSTCKFILINTLYRIPDLFIFLLLIFDAIFYFISHFLIIIEWIISFYSVIVMNYIFFVSSIVSYSMAPIYQSLSEEWLNFAASFAQVILASPLIAFYIVYVIKSIVNLGEFVKTTPKVIKNFITMYRIDYKDDFLIFTSMFFKYDYKKVFNLRTSLFIFSCFLQTCLLLAISCVIGYFLFCKDKFIIILGVSVYLLNTIQIFLLIAPSYLYFVQTLLNKKCKKVRYVLAMKKYYKKLIEIEEDSDDSKPKKADSSKETKSRPIIEHLDNLNESDSELNESSSLSLSNRSESDKSISSQSDQSDQQSDVKMTIMKAYENMKSNIKELFKEEEEDDEGKIVNDEDIEKLEFDEKRYQNIYKEMLKTVRELELAHNYYSLYSFSTEIAFDKHKQTRKRICMFFFFILNLVIIVFDIYHLINDYSDYLLASIIVRAIMIPLFSYYNILIVLYRKAKDKTIRYVNYASIVITVLIVLVIILGFSYSRIYRIKYRINDLDYFPPFKNITIANEHSLIHPICDLNIFGVSSFDAFGYALAGFDVNRNYTVFDNQMKIFFGNDYKKHISYHVYELDRYFQFLKFYDSSINTTIFAFRGYNSGPEIAFQFELFASNYIIPFFEDNVPFLGLINDYWLGFYTDFLHAFGLRFFENRNLMVKYVKSIREIYEKENFSEHDNVLFTGINAGGVIAKVVGTLSERRSISFISFPMAMDFLEHLFHFPSNYMSYVTNVFNIDGIFSKPDSEHTINIGIDTPLFHQSPFCTTGFCEIFSRVDYIYRTFCTMSETCGRGNQFNYYCRKTIGEKNLETIRENLQETD